MNPDFFQKTKKIYEKTKRIMELVDVWQSKMFTLYDKKNKRMKKNFLDKNEKCFGKSSLKYSSFMTFDANIEYEKIE